MTLTKLKEVFDITTELDIMGSFLVLFMFLLKQDHFSNDLSCNKKKTA